MPTPTKPTTKRARIDAACDRCRRRKQKCDGARPECGSCLARGAECVYGKRYSRSHVSEDYVRQLEAKLGIDRRRRPLEAMAGDDDDDGREDGRDDGRDDDQAPRPPPLPAPAWTDPLTPTVGFDPILGALSAAAAVAPSATVGAGSGAGATTTAEHTIEQLPLPLPNGSGHGSGRGSVHSTHSAGGLRALASASATAAPLVTLALMALAALALAAAPLVTLALAVPITALPANSGTTGADTDGMGAGRPDDYYGRLAVALFLNQLSAQVDGEIPANAVPFEPELEVYLMGYGSDNLDDVALPAPAVAEKFVDDYFTYAWTLYPFVHRPTFMATYRKIWDGHGVHNTLFYCILNLTMAIGSLLLPLVDLDEKMATSQVFFRRSQHLLKVDMMDQGSLLGVQALLLTGQYLQATPQSAGCWNYIGLAIRMAQGLGLHDQEPCPRLPLLLDKPQPTLPMGKHKLLCIYREMRRRVWAGCVVMDRIVLLTFGRPLMVTDWLPTEVEPVDDEYVTDEGINVPQEQHRLELCFFEQTIKLYQILGEVLQTFYTATAPLLIDDILVQVFEFEKKLNRFRDGVPEFIKPDAAMIEPRWARQANVLRLRYLHLKMMLYRSVLVPAKLVLNDLLGLAQTAVAGQCVITAIRVVKYIGGHVNDADNGASLLPAHWYNIFYVYTANTVLLAAKLQPGIMATVSSEELDEAWNMGLDLLDRYRRHSQSAEKCIRVLEVMGEKVGMATTSGQQKEMDQNMLLSLLYDTLGPLGGPFFYNGGL